MDNQAVRRSGFMTQRKKIHRPSIVDICKPLDMIKEKSFANTKLTHGVGIL